jgi:hypothetical protein
MYRAMVDHLQAKYSVLIDSSNRLSGTSDDFTIQVDLPKNLTFDHVSLTSVHIPKSFYTIPAGYNTFTLIENGTSVPVSFTPASLSRTDFLRLLPSLLNAASPNGHNYTVAYDGANGDTLKFVYAVDSDDPISLVMPSSTFLPRCFGFARGSTNTFVARSLRSTAAIQFQSHNTLIIRSSLVSQDSVRSNVLQTIIAADTPGAGSITWQNSDVVFRSKHLTGSSTDNKVSFSLVSTQDERIDLNGLDWECTLVFFKSDSTNKILKEKALLDAWSSLN